VIHDDGGYFDDAWPTLGAYLTEAAEALASGAGVNGWYPYLTVDTALWWSTANQTELNGDSLRPAPAG
jgi:hypothetical protein